MFCCSCDEGNVGRSAWRSAAHYRSTLFCISGEARKLVMRYLLKSSS